VLVQPNRPFIVRAIYFVFIGWWLTFLWINAAWVLIASVIGLPLGLWMLNRVPQVLTLKPMAVEAEVRGYGPYAQVRTRSVRQHSWPLRLIYFLFIGWWVSLLWANIAWALCVSIIGLPVGIIMFHYLPAVTTLMRTA